MAENRLHLDSMVDKHLKQTMEVPAQSHFNPYFPPHINRKSTAALVTEPRAKRSAETKSRNETSINSIIETMHSKLKSKPPKKISPFVPPIVLQMEPELIKPKKKKSISKKSNENVNMKMPKTIAQSKIRLEHQQHLRKRFPVAKSTVLTTFTNQKRINEVLKQRRILQDMLEQHKKLKRDRLNIAMEISAMKSHLNQIRNRVDTSLHSLSIRRPFLTNQKKKAARSFASLKTRTSKMNAASSSIKGSHSKVKAKKSLVDTRSEKKKSNKK